MRNQVPIPVNPKQQLAIEAFKERLAKREIWINEDITDNLVETLYVNMIKFQEESPDSEIKVIINSNGGKFYESAVATDIMGTCPNPLKTIGLANVISGGFIIFMAGKERICHDYTCLMMHSAAFGAHEKVEGIRNKVEYTEYALDKLSRFFSIQTGGKTTPEYWMELFKSEKDKWFTIEEALKLGIVHRVIKRREMIDPTFSVREPYTWDIIDFNRANQ